VETEVAVLASTGAVTLVKLMTTDAWEQVKQRVSALFGSGRRDQSELVEGDLEDTRTGVVNAAVCGDEPAIADAETEWRLRLQRLLAADPRAISELRRILEEFDVSSSPVSMHIVMKARATGHGRVNQAGHDQHFGEK
jgi:hypothetical protein